VEITRVDRDRAFIATFRITEDTHGALRKTRQGYCCALFVGRASFVAPSFVVRDTSRGTILGEKCEANAHKFTGEMRMSPDLHNPFSSGGALLLTTNGALLLSQDGL